MDGANAKVQIFVRAPGAADATRVCWYAGTSDTMVDVAVRAQLQLPLSARYLLRDGDNDLVPIATVLPPNATYELVIVPAPDESAASTVLQSERPLQASANRHERPRKRPRTQGESSDSVDAVETAVAVAPPSTRARSVARVVMQFLDVFTRPIADDDNVSFIPSTGRFALYALFCALVTDRALHPKSQDAFYKMTSLQGKVDRQRVIRYYQAFRDANGSSELEVVQYKPQGKGPLLRRYAAVDSARALRETAERAAPLAAILDRDPEETAARYMDFVRGFVPVTKAVYQAHRSDDIAALDEVVA